MSGPEDLKKKLGFSKFSVLLKQLHIIAERCRETQAYVRVLRQEVCMCIKGVSEEYICLIQQMYEGTKAVIKSSVELTLPVILRFELDYTEDQF